MGNIVHDWCRIYALSRELSTDVRRWIRIRNTDELDGYAPLSLVVIIDPELFRRNQGSKWLSDGNSELIWSYTRIDESQPEKDEKGSPCWRPIMPVRWYQKIPAWAEQTLPDVQ